LGVSDPVTTIALRLIAPAPVMVVVPAKVTNAEDVIEPLADTFPESVAFAPLLAAKVPGVVTVKTPAMLNGEVLATNEPVADTVNAPKFVKPEFVTRAPVIVSAPLTLNNEFAVRPLPALIVKLLKVAVPLPPFEKMELVPANVVVLVPALRTPVPLNE
jgi:hypothetical protein